MSILELLQGGKKLRLYYMDTDTWSYNQELSTLEQWINGVKTGLSLQVLSIDNNHVSGMMGGEMFTITSENAIIVD